MEITDSDVYDEIHLHVIIRSIIEQQLQAFQSDNSAAAFALASPDIQAQFQTPENFMKMVKTGYLPVYRPRSVVFEGISTIQGNITQSILLLSPDGTPVRAIYLMKKQPDHTWKINGCFLVPVAVEMI
jgi:Domain of unknown function (DUF4864)